jgi:Rrf2 family iron-sulfur cluster assembly transcriptional regulator
MKLTTKGRYAVTAMLDVALYQGDSPVCLEDIAGRQGISQSYLEQLFAKLRREGLLESQRGPNGGYHLTRTLSAITVREIVEAVDENVDATQCQGKEDCHSGSRCLTHQLWMDLNDTIANFLDSISLEDLINKSTKKEKQVIGKWKVSEMRGVV